MKYLLTLFCAICTCTFKVLGQDTVKTNAVVKTNPIIFGEGYIGAPIAGVSGIEYGLGLNYQIKRSLITARITEFDHTKLDVVQIAFLFGIPISVPIVVDLGYTREYAALYGLRKIKEGHSFSFSFGVSANTQVIKYYDSNYNFQYQTQKSYVGLPFELNVKWFKKNKERYRIYYLIPVGKPTGFGNSIGLKLSGNVSQYSYLAIGVDLGLGFHKHY